MYSKGLARQKRLHGSGGRTYIGMLGIYWIFWNKGKEELLKQIVPIYLLVDWFPFFLYWLMHTASSTAPRIVSKPGKI